MSNVWSNWYAELDPIGRSMRMKYDGLWTSYYCTEKGLKRTDIVDYDFYYVRGGATANKTIFASIYLGRNLRNFLRRLLQ